MTDEQMRTCPSCTIRYRVPPRNISPNVANALPMSKSLWRQLRQLAECFDRAASQLDEEEGSSGAGDGETTFTAAEFVEWMKPDTEGFHNPTLVIFDGSPTALAQNGARDPFPLPMTNDGTRSQRGRGAA